MKLDFRPRGVVLLSSLFLVLVVAMFIGAASQVGIRSLFVTGKGTQSAKSEAAAESGIQYALLQLRTDARWQGAKNAITLDTPELVVKEDNGNVVGYLRDGSQFRLRFNYQDGEGVENLPDPTMKLTFPYVSCNNVMSSTTAPVPRADAAGSSVGANSARPYQVPAFSVCLIVEGRSGNFMRGDFQNTDPQGPASSSVIEAVYRVGDVSSITMDAASMSARDFTATLTADQGEVTVDARAGAGLPRLRSKQNVIVKGGASTNYLSPNGELLSGRRVSNSLHPGPDVTIGTEDSSSAFYELAWTQVKRADPAGAALPAGTYVWWDDKSLHYYDLDYKDYLKFIRKTPSNPGLALPAMPTGVALDSNSKSMVLTGDLSINPLAASTLSASAKGAKDFTIIPRAGAAAKPNEVDTSTLTAQQDTVALYYAENEDALQNFIYTNYGASGGFETDGSTSTGNDFVFTGAAPGQTLEIKPGPGYEPNNLIPDTGQFISPLHQMVASIFTPPNIFAGPPPNYLATAVKYLEDNGLDTKNDGEIDLGAIDDDLTPTDISLDFKPATGGSATLSAPGDVRIGARLEGQGGSITAEGDIAVIGFGADFAADPNAQLGVSMYSKGDIHFSTYHVDKATDKGSFQDVKIKGVLYSWGDVIAGLGHRKVPATDWGQIDLEGALVAYGGVPGTAQDPGTPGSGKGGNVNLSVKSAHLLFDPAYLLSVMSVGPSNLPMTRTLWNRY